MQNTLIIFMKCVCYMLSLVIIPVLTLIHLDPEDTRIRMGSVGGSVAPGVGFEPT